MPRDEEILTVSEEPLVLILKLPDGCTPGSFEAAAAFAEIIAEVHHRYPGTAFEMLPFSYETLGGVNPALDSILIVTKETLACAVPVARTDVEKILDMPAEDFFSTQRFLDCGVPKSHAIRAINGVHNACRFGYTEDRFNHPTPKKPIRTMRQFLGRYEDFSHLQRTQNFGSKSREAVKKVARAAGLLLPASWL